MSQWNVIMIRLAQSSSSTLLSRSLKEIKHHQLRCRIQVENKQQPVKTEKRHLLSIRQIIIITLSHSLVFPLTVALYIFYRLRSHAFRFKFNQHEFSPCLLIFFTAKNPFLTLKMQWIWRVLPFIYIIHIHFLRCILWI